MSVIPQNVEFNNKVVWVIKNFVFSLKNCESTLTSPKFDARCLDVTSWNFYLYPRGKSQQDRLQFAIHLHFSESRELHITSVKFAISLVDGEGETYFNTEGLFSPSFTNPTTSEINLIPLDSFQDEQHLRSGGLIVICELTTKVNQVEFLSSIYNDHLISLSQNVSKMMENPTKSDLVAYSTTHFPFHLHLCILKARCPVLFSESLANVDYTGPKAVWMSNMSTYVLKILISYLYGRITIQIPHDCVAELMSVAIRYGLLDLEQKLREYPVNLTLVTEVVVEDITFEYPLHYFKRPYFDDQKIRMRFLPTRNLSVSDLVVSWEMTETNERELYIKIGFQFSDFQAEVPIQMKCALYLLGEDGRELESKEYWHTFSSDVEWSPDPFLTKSAYNILCPYALKCNVIFTESVCEDQVSDDVFRVEPGRCVFFNNLQLISQELLKLYVNQVNCDLKMKVEDHVFFGHKSFLMQRSKRIFYKVEEAEKKTSEGSVGMVSIRLRRVVPSVCQMVLLYMYSGKIEINDPETAKTLVEAADYLVLPELLDRSVFFQIP